MFVLWIPVFFAVEKQVLAQLSNILDTQRIIDIKILKIISDER